MSGVVQRRDAAEQNNKASGMDNFLVRDVRASHLALATYWGNARSDAEVSLEICAWVNRVLAVKEGAIRLERASGHSEHPQTLVRGYRIGA